MRLGAGGYTQPGELTLGFALPSKWGRALHEACLSLCPTELPAGQGDRMTSYWPPKKNLTCRQCLENQAISAWFLQNANIIFQISPWSSAWPKHRNGLDVLQLWRGGDIACFYACYRAASLSAYEPELIVTWLALYFTDFCTTYANSNSKKV